MFLVSLLALIVTDGSSCSTLNVTDGSSRFSRHLHRITTTKMLRLLKDDLGFNSVS